MELPALSHPAHLWALAFLPVLWWLALPPRPRRRQATAHLAQWVRALERLGRRPVRRRRWRLWLLLTAWVAVVLAWSGPVSGGRPGPERVVAVLDGSASMAARTPEGGSAWQQARERLRAGLAALPPDVDVQLVVAGDRLRVLRGAAARAIADVGEPVGEDRALEAITGPLAGDAGTAVWTVTDGHGPVPGDGALALVGAAGPNASLTVAGIVDRWPLPGLEVRVAVEHRGGPPLEGTLEVLGPVGEVPPRSCRVDASNPRHVESWSLSRTGREAGRLEVRWRAGADLLPTDDVVVWRLPPLPAPDIAVMEDAEAGPWIRWAAEVLAEESGGRIVEPEADGSGIGFLLVDGGRIAFTGEGVRALTFGTYDPRQEGGKPVLSPVVRDWDRRDPLTAGLDLSGLRIDTAVTGAAPGVPVVHGGQGPLISVREQAPDRASVHAAFRLGDSNLPLLPAFPQLLRRAFERAYGSSEGPERQDVPVPAEEAVLSGRSAAAERPLPEPGRPGRSWTPWLLAAAVLLLAMRIPA